MKNQNIAIKRMGMDVNGNHCVWFTVNGSRARRIQTNGNLPLIHREREINAAAIQELTDYLSTGA